MCSCCLWTGKRSHASAYNKQNKDRCLPPTAPLLSSQPVSLSPSHRLAVVCARLRRSVLTSPAKGTRCMHTSAQFSPAGLEWGEGEHSRKRSQQVKSSRGRVRRLRGGRRRARGGPCPPEARPGVGQWTGTPSRPASGIHPGELAGSSPLPCRTLPQGPGPGLVRDQGGGTDQAVTGSRTCQLLSPDRAWHPNLRPAHPRINDAPSARSRGLERQAQRCL